MKRVEVKLNLEVVAPLLDLMKGAADDLGPRLAIDAEVPDGDDRDFRDAWESELLEGQTGDIQVLLGLFDTDFFTSGTIVLDSGNAEQVLRACSALRLRLREAHLKPLGDENLESGDVPIDDMPEEQQQAFAAYVFLATLQELIVQHLDPTVLEG
jgi:Domain of unknown function (DUF2017)